MTKTNKSTGLGDTLQKVTQATGVKKAVDWLSDTLGVDCGCKERREKMNRLYPYRMKPVTCMTQEEYLTWGEFSSRSPRQLNSADQELICRLHARLFGHAYQVPCNNCPKTYIRWIGELDQLYRLYQHPELNHQP